MQKKVLSEIDLYFGEIASPKGFEINRDRIKGDILTSFINQKRINNNPQAYAYKRLSSSLFSTIDLVKRLFKRSY
jgi:hypothetical protein